MLARGRAALARGFARSQLCSFSSYLCVRRNSLASAFTTRYAVDVVQGSAAATALSDLNHSTYVQLPSSQDATARSAGDGRRALVAPTQRATPKTVRHFNFGDFGKSKDYAAAQEKIRGHDNTKTVETAKYGKRAIRATQLNGQNVLNPEPACAAL